MVAIRRFSLSRVGFFAFILMLVASVSAIAQVAITDIGTINGRASVAVGINHAGDVAGISFFSGTVGSANGPGSDPFLTHGVLYTAADRVLHDLGAIEGFPGCSPLGCQSEVFAVNDSDWAVGWTDGGTRGMLPIVWLPKAVPGANAGINILPSLDANAGSAVISINSTGQMAGFSKLPGFAPRAATWQLTQNGPVLTDLGTLRADNKGSAVADAINDLGQIVGQAADESFGQPVFLYLPQPAYGLPAGMNNLTPTQQFGISPAAINNRGEIVGDVNGVPFLWLPTAAYGQPAGFSTLAPTNKLASFVPAAISESGQIVGQAAITTNPSTHETTKTAGAWRNGNWTFLNNLLPAGSPWNLITASSITRVGKTTLIAGTGELSGVTDVNGLTPVVHGFILSVTCTGDLNDDGVIDQRDVDFLRTQLGDIVPPGTGADLNGDGIINQQDLLLLGKQLHQPCL